MATEQQRFPYNPADGHPVEGALPFLPVGLSNGSNFTAANALLDSGASVNVLPYRLGLQLGLIWDEQGQDLALGGNLSSAPAKGVVLNTTVAPFSPVRLVFAWSRLDDVPVILGQMNFFQIFDVYFFGAEQMFEISLRS